VNPSGTPNLPERIRCVIIVCRQHLLDKLKAHIRYEARESECARDLLARRGVPRPRKLFDFARLSLVLARASSPIHHAQYPQCSPLEGEQRGHMEENIKTCQPIGGLIRYYASIIISILVL
jgi:hypothetical protein